MPPGARRPVPSRRATMAPTVADIAPGPRLVIPSLQSPRFSLRACQQRALRSARFFGKAQSKFRDRIAQATFCRLHADTGNPRDVLETQPCLLVQQKYFTLLGGEVLERSAKTRCSLCAFRQAFRAAMRGVHELVRALLRFRVHCGRIDAAPVVIDETVVADREQERRKFRARFVALAARNDAAPHFLEKIVGSSTISREAQQVAIQRVLVALVETRERCKIA